MKTLLSITLFAASFATLGRPRSPDDAGMPLGVAHTSRDTAVGIRTFQFAPDTLRVNAGSMVTWTNGDDIEHTVTSGAPDNTDGRLNGVVAKRGATYSAVLKDAGTYRYFCDRHRFMNGTVIVTP